MTYGNETMSLGPGLSAVTGAPVPLTTLVDAAVSAEEPGQHVVAAARPALTGTTNAVADSIAMPWLKKL